MNSILSFVELKAVISDEVSNDPLTLKYAGWDKLDKQDEKELVRVGQLELPDVNQEYSEENYWKPESPISINRYPYAGCWIYEHPKYHSFFFVYTEFGGHVPETRCRYIDKKLIV